MVDSKKHSEYWRNGAAEDWEVAQKLIADGKPRHGLFFAHLAIEKMLKALISLRGDAPAPRIHNLIRLAEVAGLQPTEEQLNLLADMNQFNVEGRYPEVLPAAPTSAEAQDYRHRAQEILTWLTRQF